MPILKMISDGCRAVDIAKTLDQSKSLISYYIQKAEKHGYIKENPRDVFKPLELTLAGKSLLGRYEKSNPSSLPAFRLEKMILKADVIEVPSIPVDWKKIEMHNWKQYQSRVDNVSVKLNMGNNPTLELIPSSVEGDNFYDLIFTQVYDCINVIPSLQQRFGIRLGRPYVRSRPDWVFHDLVAREYCRHNGQIKYEGLAMVNASKPSCYGEFEFPDPRSLLDYIIMPKRVVIIESHLERIDNKLEAINQQLVYLVKTIAHDQEVERKMA